MNLSTRHRWLGYAGAALLTFAAMAWVDRDADKGAVVLPAARVTAAVASPGVADIPGPAGLASDAVPTLQARSENEPLTDPFGLPSENPRVAAVAPMQRAPQPAALASPPALPFAYVGRWVEQGKTTIYLQRKDRSVAVLGPGNLDDDYSVQSISDQGMVFKYRPLDTLQGLRFDAPPAVVTAAAAAAVSGRTATPPGPAPTPVQTAAPATGADELPQPDN